MKVIHEYGQMESSVSVMENGSISIDLSDCHLTQLTHEVSVEESRKIYEALKTVFDSEIVEKAKSICSEEERIHELLSDYMRDKKRIGELLGLPPEKAMIHDFQKEILLEIRRALRSDAPAFEQLNRVQNAMSMFQTNEKTTNE